MPRLAASVSGARLWRARWQGWPSSRGAGSPPLRQLLLLEHCVLQQLGHKQEILVFQIIFCQDEGPCREGEGRFLN